MTSVVVHCAFAFASFSFAISSVVYLFSSRLVNHVSIVFLVWFFHQRYLSRIAWFYINLSGSSLNFCWIKKWWMAGNLMDWEGDDNLLGWCWIDNLLSWCWFDNLLNWCCFDQDIDIQSNYQEIDIPLNLNSTLGFERKLFGSELHWLTPHKKFYGHPKTRG